MLRKLAITFLLYIAAAQARSQKYPASAIPDALKNNANVVVRLDETEWEIKSAGEATSRHHIVYTILNERGDHYATYYSYYNKNSYLINSINAYLYDAVGKEIRHYKKKDMDDLPYQDWIVFISSGKDMQGSANFFIATNHRIQLSLPSEFIQISGVFIQGIKLCLLCVGRNCFSFS